MDRHPEVVDRLQRSLMQWMGNAPEDGPPRSQTPQSNTA
jgi:hypothetical protein